MMTVNLEVAKRDPKSKIDDKEQVKGVVYGPKQDNIPLTVDRKTIEKLYAEAGESTIIQLDGLEEPAEVLIHDVEFDPILSRIHHIDFYAIERGKELTTSVPLTFVGTPPAEDQDGILNKVLHEIEITCRPSDLPHDIEVDVSGMEELDAQLKIEDIKLPEGVKTTHDGEDIVAQISTATEEPEEPEDEMGVEDVEVEGKGKEETEEE